jgi:UTP:GlnB (protein PII) uridylyltransferase
VARILADLGLDVDHAIVATWPDGAALESFLVTASTVPSETALAEAVERAITLPLDVVPLPGARVDFDDVTSPWYTLVRIDAEDEPGRLSAIAGSLSSAGIDVHSADIRGEGGTASDVFEVSGASGGKLRPEERNALAERLRTGATLPPPRSTRQRAWDRLKASWASDDGQVEEMHPSSLRD